MPTVFFNDKKINCRYGENLYRVLLRGGVEFDAPCGGNGTCGKCSVWEKDAGKIKTCECFVTKDIVISKALPRSEIAAKGYLRETAIDHKKPCIAVDIGTTTIVAYLVNHGQIIDVESAVNAQKSYGNDVISRIQYTANHENGTEVLHSLMINQIGEMTNTLLKRNHLMTDDICIAGNTTMLHLYANVSPATIGTAPFRPAFTDMKKIGNTVLLPSVSGYVGADTVAAILSSGMHLSKKKCLLIDIGTNGEIALGNEEQIVACAAAAGPAFEGAQISCGIGGVSGAINSIAIKNHLTYTTIDNAPPIGICGSGILDAAAQMLNAGMIDETGYFEENELKISDNISINAKDIRQIQLAKAAIAAGIKTLLKESDTEICEIEICYLAGGFGSFLNKKSACDIGLLPKELYDKIISIGNAAGMGAVLWQISDRCRDELDKIIKTTKYFELSGSKIFNEEFIQCMLF